MSCQCVVLALPLLLDHQESFLRTCGVSCVSLVSFAETEKEQGPCSFDTHSEMWGREINHELNLLDFSGIGGFGPEASMRI